MRAPNYYAHPGFERAGLRRREPDWIRERVLDPASVFIPVWRTQNLIIEIAESEPRAGSITVEGLLALLGALDDLDERLARGEVVFLGLIDERSHFALDVSGTETPLEMLRPPALAPARCARRPRSRLPRFTIIRRSPGRFRPISCLAFMPRRRRARSRSITASWRMPAGSSATGSPAMPMTIRSACRAAIRSPAA